MEDTQLTHNLEAECRSVEGAVRDSMRWIDDNPKAIGPEAHSLKRQLRRTARSLARLAETSQRPPTVGIFGGSQTGKSYLVSVMAGTDDALRIVFGNGQTVDFLEELNPSGGDESTALVTRFVCSASRAPEAFPVTLKLLTRNDLMRIICTSYILNVATREDQIPDQEEVKDHLEAMRERMHSAPVDDLEDEDVLELREYVSDAAAASAVVQVMTVSRFWENAAEMAPRLVIADRMELFSILWGRMRPLTETYCRLFELIDRLGNPAMVHAEMEALIPRAQGILDVNALMRIGSDDEPSIRLRTGSGREHTVPRAALAALVAELELHLPQVPREFLRSTDLLDFPGYRGRLEGEYPEDRFRREPKVIGELILRGRVDYLFRRYCNNYDINALLTLLKPSVQDIEPLPGAVWQWIKMTHGEQPDDRAKQATTLFVILSWFDAMFERKRGDQAAEDRFATRLRGALGFLSRASDWPTVWHPRRPFRNVFWFRNPSVEAAFMHYRPNTLIEDSIDEAYWPWIEQLRAVHRETPQVQEHFSEPDRAFDAGLSPRDGGATYICERLAPVCQPEMKSSQVRQELEKHRGKTNEIMRRFYVSSDIEAEVRKRVDRARWMTGRLEICQSKARFGALLRHLMMPPSELASLYQRVLTWRPAHEDRPPKDNELESEVPWGTDDERFAEAAVDEFLQRTQELLRQDRLRAYFRLTEEMGAVLLEELSAAINRLSTVQCLAREIRATTSITVGVDLDKQRIGLVAADFFARLLDELALSAVPLDQRPRGPQGIPLFQPPLPPAGVLDLPEEPTAYWRQRDADWNEAFVNLAESNARGMTGGPAVDMSQNDRLGEILTVLESGSLRSTSV